MRSTSCRTRASARVSRNRRSAPSSACSLSTDGDDAIDERQCFGQIAHFRVAHAFGAADRGVAQVAGEQAGLGRGCGVERGCELVDGERGTGQWQRAKLSRPMLTSAIGSAGGSSSGDGSSPYRSSPAVSSDVVESSVLGSSSVIRGWHVGRLVGRADVGSQRRLREHLTLNDLGSTALGRYRATCMKSPSGPSIQSSAYKRRLSRPLRPAQRRE